ncbi:MAG: hypothetical protein ACE5H7_16350 [Acidiferrobacterales bacterium]
MYTQIELLGAAGAALVTLAFFARVLLPRRVSANGRKIVPITVTQRRRERRLRCRRMMADRRADVRDDPDRRYGPGRRPADQWDDRYRL